jgi:spore coat protein SA
MSKIFHVLTESEPFSEFHGGAISRWAANVLRDDEESIVLAPSADDSWSFPPNHIRVVRGLATYKRLNKILKRILPWSLQTKLLRAILVPALRDLQPSDQVWVHNRPEFAASLQPLLHRCGARLVLVLHNSHLVTVRAFVAQSVRADRYVFVSHFLQQQALEKFPTIGPTEVLHNGADKSIFYPRPQPKPSSNLPVVLFAGRLVPDKGLHIFVEAMRLLHNKSVPLEAVVLGGAGFGNTRPTPYIEDLRRAATSNLTFQPYCSGAALGAKFRDADIFCAPSTWQEPLGLVILEAMASGLAIVASRSGGIPEMLTDGGGILVARGSATELADALELLATNPALRDRLAQEAHASFLKSFTWEAVRHNYRRIAQSVQHPPANLPTLTHSSAPNTPSISVIIPTRDRPHLLRRAIESVLRQTAQHLEVIVVLDGPDPATTKLIQAFADPRLKLISLDPPVGGSEARNIGARHATGRYIALLDDDDEWLPNKLQAQLTLADAHPRPNFVVVTQYLYRVEGQPDEIWPAHLPAPNQPLSEFLFSSRGGFQTSTYLCPRELFLRVPFTAGLKKHQDWDWFLRLAALPNFELLIVPEPLSIYWVPTRSRTSISGRLDWAFSHRWATENLSLMTRKAYAGFLVKICARAAMTQKAGPRAMLNLLRDLLVIGRPTPALLAEFIVCLLLPNDVRLRLRPAIQSWRKAHPTHA